MQRGWFPAAAAAALLIAGPVHAVPEVTTPDFERSSAVRTSLRIMYNASRKQAEASGDWRARRAEGECRNALQRLEWRRSSGAYDAQAGGRIWRFCHDAYTRLR